MRRTHGTLKPIARLFGAGIATWMVACTPDLPRLNVLVLVPDTIRADHLSINGYARATSPAIDALARDGINFSQAVSVAPRTWQSFSSILTGLYPPRHGVRYVFDRPISPDIPNLGSIFQDHGYEVAAFDTIPFVLGMTGGHGFDTYALPDLEDRRRGFTDDVAILKKAAAWMRKPRKRPFLAFIRLTGAHWPYTNGTNGRWIKQIEPCTGHDHAFNSGGMGIRVGRPGEGFEITDREAYRRKIWNADLDADERHHMVVHYDTEIHALDEAIGTLIELLRRADLLEQSVIVLTSDHGESFGEHGYLQHGPRLDEPVMRVPLIVRLPQGHPDHRVGKRIDSTVRLVDILPTLLEAAGIEPPTSLDGTSLLPLIRGHSRAPRWVYGESGRSFMNVDPQRYLPGIRGKHRMIRTDAWKLIWVPHPEQQEKHLYDLHTDPAERVDLAADRPQEVERLQRYLEQVQRTERPHGQPASPSARQIERLRSLGYME